MSSARENGWKNSYSPTWLSESSYTKSRKDGQESPISLVIGSKNGPETKYIDGCNKVLGDTLTKLSKYRGRLGRQERIDREGQAWSQDKATFEEKDIFDQPIQVHLPIGPFLCEEKGCGSIVRIDDRGFAFCEECGTIYNDDTAQRPKQNFADKFNMHVLMRSVV